MTRTTLRHTKLPGLLRLGLSEELAEKVIAVLAERELSFEDYRQLSGEGAGIPGKIATPIHEETNRQLQQLLGEETYKRYAASYESTMVMVPNADGNGGHGYSVPSHQALLDQAYTNLVPRLITRLSYSDSPLQPAQADQLAELLAMNSSASPRRLSPDMSPTQVQSRLEQPGTPIYKAMYSDSFIKEAATVLTPTQLEALRQLQAEHLAYEVRAKLPKSSELPRNTQTVK